MQNNPNPMRPIQMVDLNGQYLKIKPAIDQAIQNVIDESAFINGKHVKIFEESLQNFLEVENVIACANGTDALQLALMALELKAGDEVILPAFTFVSPAETVALLNFTPVFADVDDKTFNINAETIKSLITSKTKAIIVVHLFGQCADMLPIMQLAQQHNLFVIEDVAQSLGAKYKIQTAQYAGTIGHIGCTSFFPTKNLACFGDGGAVMTNDPLLAKKIKKLASHGQPKKYEYEIVGINSRLDALQAAILSVKLGELEKYLLARKKAAAFYTKKIDHINWIRIPSYVSEEHHTFNQYTIVVDEKIDREALIAYLKEKDIPTMVYYQNLVQDQPAYQKYATQNLPISAKLAKCVLSLPMHTELDEEQQEYITKMLAAYKNE